MITEAKVVAELNRIAANHGGRLRPDDVVQAAKPKGSVLHPYFDWDDTVAAQKWRIHQARNLIRVVVTYVGDEQKIPMRVFVSLVPDRAEGQGYRSTVRVLEDSEQRRQLLADALAEMERFQQKYAALRELAEVISAMRRAGKRLARKAA